MLQFLYKWTRQAAYAAPRTRPGSETARWRADPLAHPALRRMSQVELADLPIGHPRLPREPERCGT